MSFTTLHALDTCIDPILRFLPAKHRLFLLATCKQLSTHMKAAIADMIPEIRCVSTGGRIHSAWCEIAVNSDFVTFKYEYEYGDSGGNHRFRAVYSCDQIPPYVQAIWDGMPVPDMQTVREISIEGDKTFAEVAVAGMIRENRYEETVHAEYSIRTRLLCLEGVPDEEWEASFIHYGSRDRTYEHLRILKQIMEFLDVPVDEYEVPYPIEPDESLYDPVRSGDEVEEVYGTNYERMQFERRVQFSFGYN